MSYPNRPPVSEILSAIPELAPYGKQAAMLYPEPGAPGIQDSSIGGPLLWPIEDPWPTCRVPDEEDESGLPANAMVPVAQIFARDVPGPWWPAGLDLLQILWCPTSHWDPLSKQIHPGSNVITCLAGWKVGGWPTWHVTYPQSPDLSRGCVLTRRRPRPARHEPTAPPAVRQARYLIDSPGQH